MNIDHWIEDSYRVNLNDAVKHEILTILEPYRESIELRLDAYNEEKHNWKEYRNSLWFIVHPDDEKVIEGIIEKHIEDNKVRFLLRVAKEASGKKAKEAADLLETVCREEVGSLQASRALSILRVTASVRYETSTGELPKKLPALIRWIEREEKLRRVERYQVLLEIIEPGKMVHIDEIYQGLYPFTETGKLEQQEAEMLERIHDAMADQVLFADGDYYGRMYYACMQAEEAAIVMVCGCHMRMLSTGAVVLWLCKAHEKATP